MGIIYPIIATAGLVLQYAVDRLSKKNKHEHLLKLAILICAVIGAWLLYILPSDTAKNLEAIKSLETPREVAATPDTPISFRAVAFEQIGTYPKGTEIAGIKWDPTYADVRVNLTNTSPNPLSSVDLRMSLDSTMAIMAISQISALPYFYASPDGEVPALWLKGREESGKPVTIPVVPSAPGFGNTFRVYCSTLLPGAVLQLVLAAKSIPAGLPRSSHASPKIPRSIKVSGTYEQQLPKPLTRYTFTGLIECKNRQ